MAHRAIICGKCVLFGAVMLCIQLFGSPAAIAAIFDNGGGTGRWDNPANWGGTLPSDTIPGFINNHTVLIDNVTTAVSQDSKVGQADGSVGVLNMTGGSFDTKTYFALGEGISTNATGTFNMSSGNTIVRKDLYVGSGNGPARGVGHLIMSDGVMNVLENVYVGAFGGHPGQSTIQLDGGTLQFELGFTMGPVGSALMDIAGGEFVWIGDKTTQIQSLITSGNLTAFGGSGTFNIDYDVTHEGYTTVTAVPEPATTLGITFLTAAAFIVRRRF